MIDNEKLIEDAARASLDPLVRTLMEALNWDWEKVGVVPSAYDVLIDVAEAIRKRFTLAPVNERMVPVTDLEAAWRVCAAYLSRAEAAEEALAWKSKPHGAPSDRQELIADARDLAKTSRLMNHGVPSHMDMIDDLADALENATQAATEPSDAQVEALVDAAMSVAPEPFKTWRYRMTAALRAAGGVD